MVACILVTKADLVGYREQRKEKHPMVKRAQTRKKYSAREKRCNEVNKLFDAVAHELGMREWEIFQAVYEDEREAYKQLGLFLKHVGDCPSEVVRLCQELLAGHKKTTKSPDG